jgi:hypothetical protein
MAASRSRPRNLDALPPSAKRRVAELPQDRIIPEVYYAERYTSSVRHFGGLQGLADDEVFVDRHSTASAGNVAFQAAGDTHPPSSRVEQSVAPGHAVKVANLARRIREQCAVAWLGWTGGWGLGSGH